RVHACMFFAVFLWVLRIMTDVIRLVNPPNEKNRVDAANCAAPGLTRGLCCKVEVPGQARDAAGWYQALPL
ncbi:hypothetical protein, partial [Abyssibius alkaniclasticus]|uniref:hypothetical protein n=1 Tax=Abyssibius alkaniclasticus TaxID=2881234 RepID=UPI004059E577